MFKWASPGGKGTDKLLSEDEPLAEGKGESHPEEGVDGHEGKPFSEIFFGSSEEVELVQSWHTTDEDDAHTTSAGSRSLGNDWRSSGKSACDRFVSRRHPDRTVFLFSEDCAAKPLGHRQLAKRHGLDNGKAKDGTEEVRGDCM